jgi:hypothetical protein
MRDPHVRFCERADARPISERHPTRFFRFSSPPSLYSQVVVGSSVEQPFWRQKSSLRIYFAAIQAGKHEPPRFFTAHGVFFKDLGYHSMRLDSHLVISRRRLDAKCHVLPLHVFNTTRRKHTG